MRIAVSCPTVSGHLNPSLALAAELQGRGHDVLFLALRDAEAKAQAAGIRFCAVAEDDYPPGRLPELLRELGLLSGFAATRFTIKWLQRENLAYFRDLPRICQREGFDGMVLDQISSGAASIAQALRIPYVTIANALWLSRDTSSPPCNVPWPHRSDLVRRMQNWLAHLPLRAAIACAYGPINQRRRALGLEPLNYFEWAESRLAVVAQQPEGFEFPEVRVPAHVHFAGPFHRPETREPAPFPYERLNGRPLIYASMGTLQNRLLPVFRAIAAACVGVDAQLVIALGASDAPLPGDLPGDPIVVPFAPQLELLQRASLVITHAGLNTALESLAHGLPMIAIPITNDQPGVAARLARLGAAEVIPFARVNEHRLRAAIHQVLASPGHREAAKKMQRQIAAAEGLQTAAQIIEEAISSNQPANESHVTAEPTAMHE